VFHSDRGSQYASKAFRRRLFRYRMEQRMSRKGNCWDNAVAESFFATLKKELVRDHVFSTRDAARSEYIEVFYDQRQLFLPVDDNHFCRSSPSGWPRTATAPGPGSRGGEREVASRV
jgi:transposase InsO family protein